MNGSRTYATLTNTDDYAVDDIIHGEPVGAKLSSKDIKASTNFTITGGSYFQLSSMEHNLISRGLWMTLAGMSIYVVGVNLLETNKDDETIVILARVTMGVGLLTIIGAIFYFIFSRVEKTRAWKKLDEGKIFYDNELGTWKTAMLVLHIFTSVVLFIILLIFASLRTF